MQRQYIGAVITMPNTATKQHAAPMTNTQTEVHVALSCAYGGAYEIGPVPLEVAQELHDLSRALKQLNRKGVERWEARLSIQKKLQLRTSKAMTDRSVDGSDLRFATRTLQRYFGTDPVDPVTIAVGMHMLLEDAMWALLCTHQSRPWSADPFDSIFSHGNIAGVCTKCGIEAARARQGVNSARRK